MLVAKAGMRLTSLEELSARHKLIATHCRLSNLPPAQLRFLADEGFARAAFSAAVKPRRKTRQRCDWLTRGIDRQFDPNGAPLAAEHRR